MINKFKEYILNEKAQERITTNNVTTKYCAFFGGWTCFILILTNGSSGTRS